MLGLNSTGIIPSFAVAFLGVGVGTAALAGTVTGLAVALDLGCIIRFPGIPSGSQEQEQELQDSAGFLFWQEFLR